MAGGGGGGELLGPCFCTRSCVRRGRQEDENEDDAPPSSPFFSFDGG